MQTGWKLYRTNDPAITVVGICRETVARVDETEAGFVITKVYAAAVDQPEEVLAGEVHESMVAAVAAIDTAYRDRVIGGKLAIY